MNRRSELVGPLYVTLLMLVVIAVFWPTIRDLFALGAGTDEVTHRILAIPVFFVLVWGLRFELSRAPIHSFWLGLIGIAGAGLVWLVGELSFIRLLTNVAVIAMVPMAVLTIFGYRWLWVLSFPLFYLWLAIPFRGPLVPLQVDWTARFTFAALLASGVPVHREGPYFELPSGTWSIADTCSGIEYLSACIMLGVLYAWTMYTSTRKRLLFIGGALVVGICGNWLRAYLTIFIAHLSDNRFLRDGNGTFGWVMFATLLFAYCWAGWQFRDLESTDGAGQTPGGVTDPQSRLAENSTSGVMLILATGIVLAAMFVWPAISRALSSNRPQSEIAISAISPVSGWIAVEKSPVDWTPTLVNPTRERIQTFEKDGRRVDVFIGLFASQTWSSKLVTSVNHFIPAESAHWTLVYRGDETTTYLGKQLEVKAGNIIGGGQRIAARQWYWIDGTSTGIDTQAKLEQLRSRFNGKDDISAWVAIYTVADPAQDTAAGTLNEFMRDMGPSLERALIQTIQPPSKSAGA